MAGGGQGDGGEKTGICKMKEGDVLQTHVVHKGVKVCGSCSSHFKNVKYPVVLSPFKQIGELPLTSASFYYYLPLVFLKCIII